MLYLPLSYPSPLLLNFAYFDDNFINHFYAAWPVNFTLFQHCFFCLASDSTVPEDAGIEPSTAATSALAVRLGSDIEIVFDLFVSRMHFVACRL
jgi:hypothetical protein